MGGKIEVHPDAIKFILSKIKKGSNMSKIYREMHSKTNFRYTYPLLYDRVRKDLGYRWDGKVWIKKENIDSQESTSDNPKNCTKTKDPKDKDLKDAVLDVSPSSNKSISMDEFNSLKDDMDSIKYHVSELNSQVKQIFDVVSTIKSDDPYKESHDSINKFMAILTSGNDKCSLTLNTKVKEEILEMMAEKFGIKSNESKAINTALSLALFYLKDS